MTTVCQPPFPDGRLPPTEIRHVAGLEKGPFRAVNRKIFALYSTRDCQERSRLFIVNRYSAS